MFFKVDFGVLTIAFWSFMLVGCKSTEVISFKAKGCCPTCEKFILTAVSSEDVKSASWDQFDESLTVEFFTGSTTSSELKRRVALAGYDTGLYLASTYIYLEMPAYSRYRD